MKGLIVDQTIEKVSFCAPDRNHEKGFAYICRDGTTRRWLCHGFFAVKESVSSACPLSYLICYDIIVIITSVSSILVTASVDTCYWCFELSLYNMDLTSYSWTYSSVDCLRVIQCIFCIWFVIYFVGSWACLFRVWWFSCQSVTFAAVRLSVAMRMWCIVCFPGWTA